MTRNERLFHLYCALVARNDFATAFNRAAFALMHFEENARLPATAKWLAGQAELPNPEQDTNGEAPSSS